MKSEGVGIYGGGSALDKGRDVEVRLADLRSFVEARGACYEKQRSRRGKNHGNFEAGRI